MKLNKQIKTQLDSVYEKLTSYKVKSRLRVEG